ncbi:hypothetical protein GTP81_08445 [Rugamonas sp. FT107W]|uniref:TfoX N-terminal domain-containing protein n=1 Tax=Duganella vulcania TaxID=2692166 RepID=A0A845HD92_9BURK|nr:hypothetical protein [Duganella vulcania]MYN16780.1 hypothetical protein [Duganella vulcania]
MAKPFSLPIKFRIGRNMITAVSEYAKLVIQFAEMEDTKPGQMFGKSCLKVNGKAFVSQHRDWLVFKLSGEHHSKALRLDGAELWDPSGRGRPMKEWVAVPAMAHKHFSSLAQASYEYVAAGA